VLGALEIPTGTAHFGIAKEVARVTDGVTSSRLVPFGVSGEGRNRRRNALGEGGNLGRCGIRAHVERGTRLADYVGYECVSGSPMKLEIEPRN
jgi:hypothetical protein